jgi:putative heme transporter
MTPNDASGVPDSTYLTTGSPRDTSAATNARAAGLTLIGGANAAVVAIGAVVLGVPLVGTIALVSFITRYVPYLGAFVAGVFAVLIAYEQLRAGDRYAEGLTG